MEMGSLWHPAACPEPGIPLPALPERGELAQRGQGEIFIRLFKGKPGSRLGRRRGESAQTRAGSSTALAGTRTGDTALLSPILAAREPLGVPTVPQSWCAAESGHTGSGLLLADSKDCPSPQPARTQGPQTLGWELVPAGALRQHQELGEWGKLGTHGMEWLHTGPTLQPQPGKCCPKPGGRQGGNQAGEGPSEDRGC